MNPSVAEIERVVAEVLLRLQQPACACQQKGPSTSGGCGCDSKKKEVTGPQQDPSHLQLPGNVISVAQLQDKLAGVKRVSVAPRAVVTPAARDLLRDRGIQLDRSAAATGSAAPAGKKPFALAISDTTFCPAQLASRLNKAGLAVQRLPQVGLAGVVQEMTGHVTHNGGRGLLITEHAPAAVCLANRRSGIQAVAAQNCQQLEEISRSLAVNLLVIDPRGMSSFQLEQLALRFVESTSPSPLPEWHKYL